MNRNQRRPRRYQSISPACALLFVLGCVAAATPARAGIVSATGVAVVPAPSSVLVGATTTANQPIIFSEITGGVSPPVGMPVDHLVSGNVTVSPTITGNVLHSSLVTGTIPAGTPYESYFFHFDPVDSPFGGSYPLVDIVFSNQILGLQLFSTGDTGLKAQDSTPYVGKLEAGDGIAFPPGFYPSGTANRGLESGDAFQIAMGGFQIKLGGVAYGAEIDQVRIFVAIPEPASLGMAFIATLGIMGLGRTRFKAARS